MNFCTLRRLCSGFRGNGCHHWFFALPRAAVAIAFFAGVSSADPADLLGVYFDQSGTTTSTTTSQPNESVTYYLAVVSPSASGGIVEFMGTVRDFGDSAGFSFTPFGSCWHGWVPFPTLVLICDVPLPSAEVVVLGSYTIFVASPSSKIEIFVTLGEGVVPYYISSDGNEQIYLTPVSGSFDLPVAIINDTPVETATVSWAEIKALYR